MLRMLFIVVLLVIIALIFATNRDESKQGRLDAAQKRANFLYFLNRKVWGPIYDFMDAHTNYEKKQKKQAKYRKAGFGKLNFASNTLLCFLTGLGCAVGSYFGLKNIFLSVVMFAFGWVMPSLIVDFIANRRMNKLNAQVGMFMRMVIKRYQASKTFYDALVSTLEDFEGEEPMRSELEQTIYDVQRGESISDSLNALAKRTDNQFLQRFADYYEITNNIGTDTARRVVLEQALTQYEKYMERTKSLKRQLSELSMEAYIMLGFVPVVIVYQIYTGDDYLEFMTTTLLGQVGTAVIFAVWLLCFWVINVKLAAPIETNS